MLSFLPIRIAIVISTFLGPRLQDGNSKAGMPGTEQVVGSIFVILKADGARGLDWTQWP